MEYRHTQIGWAIILALGGVLLLFAVITANAPGVPGVVQLVGAVLLVCLFMFCSLTVTVDDNSVRLRFGPGPVARRVALGDIQEIRSITLPWWAISFGLRMSLDAKRQLWRVSGWRAVGLTLPNGRELFIGSDEADELAAVIRAAKASGPPKDS